MLRVLLLLAAGCLTLPNATHGAAEPPAAAARVRFSIPAQPLAAALIAFSHQANVQVLTAGSTVARLRSSGVEATLAPDVALARLLRGTGLVCVFLDANTVAVKRAESAADAEPARAGSRDSEALEPITVLGVHAGGFMVDTSDSVTRVDTDVLDLPESVSVVPQDLLDSQQAFSVADAVRNIAGVQFEYGTDALAQFRIRGFFVGNGMTDGLPNNVASYGDLPPLAGIDRIEALKGPQAILGDSSVNNNFGGLVNIVLKKPTDAPISALGFLRDGYGDTQINLDQGGALGADSPWTYRLIASGESAERTPQGHLGPRNLYLAPALGWHDANNRLVVGLQALIKHEPLPDYSVLLGTTLATATPAGLLIGNPHDHSVFDSTRLSYAFEHDFNADWILRSRGQYLRQFVGVEDWQLSGFSPNGDVAQVLAESYRYTDTFYTLQNDVVGHIGEGTVRHVVAAGFDYSRSLTGINDDYLAQLSGPYNVFTSPPLPRARPLAMTGTDEAAPAQPWTADKAWFVQDQVAIGEHWHVLAALRRWNYPVFTYDANGNPVTERRTHWVPNLGALYRLTPGISLYASAIHGFQPDQFLGKNGQLLPPSNSRQFESGVKFEFGARSLLTIAQYRIHLDHSYDVLSPKPPYFILPGPGQDNRGVEVEFNGNLRKGLDLSANYTNAMVDNRDGSAPTGQARHRLSAWLSYRFQRGALQNWSVAGGVLANSATQGLMTDGATYFRIPGQARVDANLAYHAERWSVTLGVRNLFDRTLRTDDFDETFMPLQPGRDVLLSGSWNF